MSKGKRAYFTTIASLILFSVFLNLAAWRSAAFSDFYVTNVFPVITGFYGRLTSLFGFSIGEVMLVILVAFIAFVVIFIMLHTFVLIYEKGARNLGFDFFKLKRVFDFISGKLYRITPFLMAVVCAVMSLNCFVLYHTSKLRVYDAPMERRYDLQQLADLRDFVVMQCNDLSKKVPHDEYGNVIYEGNMEETAIRAMQNLSLEYPRLGGYYVTPKPLHYSDFMCQQYMQGYYFPFSMEANYNTSMSIMNKPFTMCHELAHTHGYIYEDEANFFGFLACIRSDDVVFRYSGYLGVLNYINNDFYRAVSKEEYESHVKISARVKYDNQFVTQEAWKRVEKHAVIKTETVKKAADTFIDTNLKVNGVLTGKVSYTHVVALILDYYYNEPEYALNISGDRL
ncbi:DUF3810 domain-containing protein [Butyrivibrio sp. XB500-5]|uniref:DUF3810 domain-containing protein n=1 Tax=Butyrivibrio sp. XB500-5 TaxID=2364880 RepID=UPI000EAA462D|nr:DUF3810 domain-containing protein [Butyrivibrio sp. XB500-5]RKM61573.1 DUF3810 domain-containing protein [Butyrivibrio sp. XB500-5]